jgi:hypothetical protein
MPKTSVLCGWFLALVRKVADVPGVRDVAAMIRVSEQRAA